ncbi:class I SAM-dependent methyltransferase [Propionivibrio sp.]|uniref:class I SAM-dependent methyltransferase n=1 Tax=Propionivibrio sp. TaxID=2212460 RepID=UPI0025EA6D1A|nr:class I SAM-dependent methyltransferase [Propionivibrio sp.]MBK7357139.1 class I SAM-dependent methyltransferase [Propionivibrio sp.]MBK8401447.1 class I SAM-dependent methyltransferase [Propionivibrio sp.]MBK8745370.1 class I SAM-dependent methyltransferase [Propionivibrio sp.]MBK8894144.1 class I SAM-dependent methyltransferase [Propionivibrio sp.]
MEDPKSATQRLAREYADRDDPNGWFEAFYARAGGDICKVYWADLKPNPLLLDWIKTRDASAGTRAITIGCGLGDDAEALSQHGYRVTAFDISPSAIAMCRQRYPGSTVDYRVADLFDLPVSWSQGFDLVYECNTIQILVGPSRAEALAAISDLVAPGGEILVSCRSRNAGEQLDSFPLALDRDEIEGFLRAGLIERHFVAYDDDQDPPVPHFFAVYRRPL